MRPGKVHREIDGATPTIMALDRAIRCGKDTPESIYDSRGLLVLSVEREIEI